MNVARFCKHIEKDPRFVCKRDDSQSIVTVWSTHESVPILARHTYRPYTKEEASRPIEYAVDEPGEQPGFRCMTVDQYSIVQARFGWDEWGRLLGRELRKNKESRLLDDLLRAANQIVDAFPDHVTCGTKVGFDLLRKIAGMVGRGDEFWRTAKMNSVMQKLAGGMGGLTMKLQFDKLPEAIEDDTFIDGMVLRRWVRDFRKAAGRMPNVLGARSLAEGISIRIVLLTAMLHDAEFAENLEVREDRYLAEGSFYLTIDESKEDL